MSVKPVPVKTITRKDLTKAIPTDILYELANAFDKGLHGQYIISLDGTKEPKDRKLTVHLKKGEQCHVEIDKI